MTETTSAPRRIRNLVSPLKTWRGLPNAAKFVLYTRGSLQSMPVFMTLGFIFGLTSSEFTRELPPWLLLVGVAYAGLLTGLAVAVCELHPDLNTRPRAAVEPVFWAGLVLSTVGLLIGLGLQVSVFVEPVQFYGVALGMLSLLVLCLAYFPWLPYRWWVSLAAGVGCGVVFTTVVGAGFFFWLLPPFFTATVVLSLWTVSLMKEVERSRELETSLRITEERLRFAQELHDTLGQHLAAMSVKAELSLALARRGDDRLEEELQQLQKLTRTSMSDMREVVQGYRAINLATEVEGARSLLADAGLELTVRGDVHGVDKSDRELAAWFVREAATNVLRHSEARHVTLQLEATAVSMRNDGAHGGIGRLSGLDALRRRAEKHGARLHVEREEQIFTACLTLGEKP